MAVLDVPEYAVDGRYGPSVDLEPRLASLSERRSFRWRQYPAGIMPSHIAEMDFTPAAPIQRALERLLRERDYGYPLRLSGNAETAVRRAFADRMAGRFGWEIDPDQVRVTTDLVQAVVAVIVAFTEPGDGVLVQVPCYPPFRQAIAETGRRLIEYRLEGDGDRGEIDIEAFDAAAARARLAILCNPHNPSGHVFSTAELQQIAGVALARDLVVFSDEIHADFVYDGGRHVPIGALGPNIAARTITANSPSKSFNIPGLRCAGIHFGSPALLRRFHERVPELLLGRPSSFGIDGFVSAWTECQPWLDELLPHLRAMRDLVVETIGRDMPQLRLRVPQATYLAWLDCSALRLARPAAQHFLEHARIAFSPGEAFDPALSTHIRLNFGTSRSLLTELLARMAELVSRRP